MKVVILAGGKGTRLSEETEALPKPMVEIGGKPMIWHVMKIYSQYGFNEFIICLGYRGYIIKEYFSHYFLHISDVTINIPKNSIKVNSSASEPWKITLADTGIETMTGGRLKRIRKYIGKESFMMTYGDGVGDINIPELIKTHKRNKRLATLTAIQTAGRFGLLDINRQNIIKSFLEKPKEEGSWINAGFFVLEPEIFDLIEGDDTTWERGPMESLAKKNELFAYKHKGFWKCMDSLRDKFELERLWNSGNPPWKTWK